MRLDQYLVENNHVETRSEAKDIITRGFVLINDKPVLKAGYEIKPTDILSVTQRRKYVSRAGEKLEFALKEFEINLTDQIVVDVGSSTGGFTQCALSFGAKKVYAYDVGTDQLDPSLRQDERISLFEKTNILDVNIPTHDFMMIDVSFTSVIPILRHVAKENKALIVLIKPQFEVSAKDLKKGIVKNQKTIQMVIEKVVTELKDLNYHIYGYLPSPIKGKEGNQEYLLYVKK